MLKEWLIVKTSPVAAEENVVLWADYRVTVLGERLFRLEKSENGVFRDRATQAVWYRNAEKQNFTFVDGKDTAMIETPACKLLLRKERGQVCVEIDNRRVMANNMGNLLGTYRTLDGYDGEDYVYADPPTKIQLGSGVCSKTGVAVLDDSKSFSLNENGEVIDEQADGTDEYIFAFGKDYRAAVRALYDLTGTPPLVPRFALGNWWSRYHIYTDKEYLRVLSTFDEREVPLTVATIDMDWHYSTRVDEQFSITESGLKTKEIVGRDADLGWTGYTWNHELFPDPKSFLTKIEDKNLKITLNLHPSDGVRFWEEAYEKMGEVLGFDTSEKRRIPFDFTSSAFINAYFEVLHRPHEEIGVDFWWMDWQQRNIPWTREEGYDPLWALNHYHYLDNAHVSETPVILSRYAGVGSHRYPVGFSGDTYVTWKTLAYLPYFTLTASNVGYVWWSHDIGGHHNGEKSDELFVRHLQYGVFSPINRLHCTHNDTITKEPWAYRKGAGLIAEEFLRLRHRMIPYLYSASEKTTSEGAALVEPLYYEWDCAPAYRYKNEYLFGRELLVVPVTNRCYPDGYARVRAWLPEGKWTDIFTGDSYEVAEGGKELVLYRTLDSIPVLARAGSALPFAMDKGNDSGNPEKLEVWAYSGKGEYTLYEDGKQSKQEGQLRTKFVLDESQTEGVRMQSLTISSCGNGEVIPQNRKLFVRFKDLPFGAVTLFVDGVKTETEEWLTDCSAIAFPFEAGKEYRVELVYKAQTRLEKWLARADKVLIQAEGNNCRKYELYGNLHAATTEEEFVKAIDESYLSEVEKLRLKETL